MEVLPEKNADQAFSEIYSLKGATGSGDGNYFVRCVLLPIVSPCCRCPSLLSSLSHPLLISVLSHHLARSGPHGLVYPQPHFLLFRYSLFRLPWLLFTFCDPWLHRLSSAFHRSLLCSLSSLVLPPILISSSPPRAPLPRPSAPPAHASDKPPSPARRPARTSTPSSSTSRPTRSRSSTGPPSTSARARSRARSSTATSARRPRSSRSRPARASAARTAAGCCTMRRGRRSERARASRRGGPCLFWVKLLDDVRLLLCIRLLSACNAVVPGDVYLAFRVSVRRHWSSMASHLCIR